MSSEAEMSEQGDRPPPGPVGASATGQRAAGSQAAQPAESAVTTTATASHGVVTPSDEARASTGDADGAGMVEAIQEAAEARPFTEILQALESQVQAITAKLNEFVRLADRREDLVTRLHDENQRLRAGELTQAQAPVLRELIRTYDLVMTLKPAEDETDGADMDLVRLRLLDALEQFGVRPLEAEEGAVFDTTRHAAVARTTTLDDHLDMTVRYTSRVGFVQDGDRVLRPADVEVRRYRAPLPKEPLMLEDQRGDETDVEE